MPEENVFAERLKLTRETLKLKQKEFAARLNISAASYSEIESGKYKPNYEFIYNLAKEFNVNLYYLLFGKGDMFLEPDRFIGTGAGRLMVNREEVDRFLWYFNRSPIVQFLTLANFRTVLRKDKEAIDLEISESDAK